MRSQKVGCDLETEQHREEINKSVGISRNVSSLVEVFCDYVLTPFSLQDSKCCCCRHYYDYYYFCHLGI